MSIPANALSDEECLHYAALDPAAAAELTRRLTSQSIDPSWPILPATNTVATSGNGSRIETGSLSKVAVVVLSLAVCSLA